MKLHIHRYVPHEDVRTPGSRFAYRFIPHGHCSVCDKIKYDTRNTPNGGYLWTGGIKWWLCPRDPKQINAGRFGA